MARFDTAGRMIAGGSVAAILIVLLGAVVGAWSLTGYALVVLVAAGVALVVAYLASPAPAGSGWPIPARDVVIAAGLVMTVLSVLRVLELLFDIDDVDEAGGVVGLIVTIGIAIAAVVVLLGAVRWRTMSDLAGAARRGDRGTRLALGGLALDLVAWLAMLTISVYALGQTSSFGIAASLLAVLVLVLGADAAHGWRLPIPAAWIAVGLSLVATLTLFDQFGQYGRINDRFGLDAIDSILFFAHAIATLLILAGSILSAVDHQRRVTPASPSPTGGDVT